jgi:hypothetical protein
VWVVDGLDTEPGLAQHNWVVGAELLASMTEVVAPSEIFGFMIVGVQEEGASELHVVEDYFLPLLRYLECAGEIFHREVR